MEIRPYGAQDRDGCLAIFDSIWPSGDRTQLAAFLDSSPSQFFIAEHDSAIVGCGGFAVEGEQGRLLWGMVHRRWQRQGLGRFLLFYRMREITRNGTVATVNARVPAAAAPFYAAQGFREVHTAGAEVEMTKRLAVCGGT
jgi:N-acetylglutamate synthase-like GNAT family acetyltransferase